MPISVPCPHCHKKWKLKDDYAGKRIKCPNAECAQILTVPAATPAANGEVVTKPAVPRAMAQPAVAKPVAPPPNKTPVPETIASQAEAERIAAAMFHDEMSKVDAPVADTRTFDYTCIYCEHKWTLPIAQQGKNVLCPECRQRQKIPEKKEVKIDWRDPNAQRPSLARGPELPEDLKDQQTKNVNIESLVSAGAIPEVEVEPRPLAVKIKFAVALLALVGGIVFAVLFYMRSRSDTKDLFLHKLAVDSIQDVKDDGGLAKGQAAFFRAALNTAAGEAAIRLNDKTRVKEALGHFNKARQELEDSPKSYERDYLLGELAVAILSLGGTPEQVSTELRLNWKPELQKNNQPRFTGNGNDVQAELRRVLLALKADGKAAELDFRLSVVRRVARALIAKGQLDTLQEILAQGFGDAETVEAKAHVYLERIRAGAAPDKLAAPGEDFTPTLEQRYANAAGSEALVSVKKTGTPEQRLQALALIAEFSNDPKSAVVAASEIIAKEKATIGKGISPMLLIRLSYWAGKTSEKAFAEVLTDPSQQALADAEMIRGQIAANPSGKIAVATLPRPLAAQAVVGQVCGTLIGCRQNAFVTRDKKEAEVYKGWNAGTFRAAGLLGLALGLQDTQEK